MTHPTIQQTIVTMMALHDGQVDKAGAPYFHHPMRVMLRLGENAVSAEQHAALLHDVIEDTAATAEFLRELGYTEEEIIMVELMTAPKSMTYRDYIRRLMISGNAGAQRIKLADLYDNSSEIRLEGMEETKAAGIRQMIAERYKPAIFQLKLVLGDEAKMIISEDMQVEIHVEEVKDDING